MPEDTALITERPFLSPHHSVTRAVLIGGVNIPTPGLITLAHLGVLFLDEISEYKSYELNSLREPLENREITIRRLTGAYRYPARPLLVAASNPCPCGYYPDMNRCKCTPKEVLRYQKRISGPFIDRIDCREVSWKKAAGPYRRASWRRSKGRRGVSRGHLFITMRI